MLVKKRWEKLSARSTQYLVHERDIRHMAYIILNWLAIRHCSLIQ